MKVHSLIGRIDISLMRDAFKAVKRNRGAAGVDKVSIQMYRANCMDNLHALMRKLERWLLPAPASAQGLYSQK